jgi:hypothetical protein
MKYAVGMVNLAMPEGIDRNEALQEYSAETGLSLKKAEEHFDLLESTGRVRYDDLRYYTTPKGLRWAGFTRDEKGDLLDAGQQAEEQYREIQRTNAQKASSNKASLEGRPGPPDESEAGSTRVIREPNPNKNSETPTRTRRETGTEGR